MAEPSWQDLYDLGKVTLQTRRPQAVVNEGDVYDAIIAGAATMASAIIAFANQRFRSAFLDGAEGSDLTDLAYDRGVEREPGSQAIGTVTLTRATAAAGAGTVAAGTRIRTEADSTGAFVVITLDSDFVFGGATLSVSGTATAEEIGTEGNIGVNTLDSFLDIPFDTSLVPTNTQFAGGAPEETDEDLRDRVRGFFLTQARGTIEALKFGARQVAGVDRVTVTVDSAGVVTVYVADAEGNSSAALVAAVTAELENWRDAADVVYVTGGVIVLQNVTYSLTVRTGTDVAAIVDTIADAITSRIGRLNPGETLYRDMITAAIRDVDRDNILAVTLTVPAANVAPSANQLIRAGTITNT